MCRTRRSSSSRCTPFPHRQQRQRRPSSNKQNKQGGGGGKGSGKFFKKGTPNKKKGGPPKNKNNIHSLALVKPLGGDSISSNNNNRVGLSGPAHPPKEKYLLAGPTHPPKVKYSLQTDSGELCSNSFVCYALGNGNGKQVDNCNKKYKVYTDTDSDGKTEIVTDITCKYKGKVFAMEVKVDPGSETICTPLSHFRCLFPQMCGKDGNQRRQPWNQLWHSSKHMMEAYCMPMDGSSCQHRISATTSFIL